MTAFEIAVVHLLKKERAKHLPISLEGKQCDELLFNLDPSLRADIMAKKKAAIDAQKASLSARLAEIERASNDLNDIIADDALLLTDGGTKDPIPV